MLARFFELRLATATGWLTCVRLPMRRIKRSTWPAVSTMRCSPVKNGWQLLQRSVFSTSLVDIVCQLLPQAQVTVAITYLG